MTPRREIRWDPGFDHRRDPDPAKRQYGCNGLTIRWLLHGAHATVCFTLMTPWLPTWTTGSDGKLPFHVLPASVGYHALWPQYEDQKPVAKCEFFPGSPCYSDSNSMVADDVFKLLVTEGEEAVWRYLVNYLAGVE